MNQPRLRIGDRVVVDAEVARAADRGVIYQVTKTLKVNVIVEPEGGGRPMRINPIYLLPAPQTPTTAIDAAGRPYQPPLDQGTVVTVAGPGWTQPPDQLYVVLRNNGDRLAIAKLGGEQGRYWRVGRSRVTVIDPTRITLTGGAAEPAPEPVGADSNGD